MREALIRLETRGIVHVSTRRGWFVIEPSIEEAREAFDARRAIELGILYSVDKVDADAIAKLKQHLAQEQDAIRSGDVAARSYLLGDFHVCMADALGSRLLADILRDLTARTMLISMLYQSTHDAAEVLRRARRDRRGDGSGRPRSRGRPDGASTSAMSKPD